MADDYRIWENIYVPSMHASGDVMCLLLKFMCQKMYHSHLSELVWFCIILKHFMDINQSMSDSKITDELKFVIDLVIIISLHCVVAMFSNFNDFLTYLNGWN